MLDAFLANTRRLHRVVKSEDMPKQSRTLHTNGVHLGDIAAIRIKSVPLPQQCALRTLNMNGSRTLHTNGVQLKIRLLTTTNLFPATAACAPNSTTYE